MSNPNEVVNGILSAADEACKDRGGPCLACVRSFAIVHFTILSERLAAAEETAREDSAALTSIQGALVDSGLAVGPQDTFADTVRALTAERDATKERAERYEEMLKNIALGAEAIAPTVARGDLWTRLATDIRAELAALSPPEGSKP